MNLFRLIHLIVTNNIRAMVRMGQDAVTHSLRLLKVAVVVPGILLVVGIAFDLKTLVMASGLLNLLLLTLFTVWAEILAHLVVLKSNIAHAVWEKVPDLERADAQKFIRWLRGITLWISLVWVGAMVLPVREHVSEFLLAVTAALILASIASVRQWDGKVFWAAYALIAISTLGFSLLSMASPDSADRLRSTVSFHVSKVRSLNARNEKLETVLMDSRVGDAELDKILLGKMVAKRQELKLKGIETCGGRICPKDLEEYLRLNEDIAKLKGKTYWPEELEEQDDDVASMPPPPVRKVKAKVAAPVTSEPASDEVYSELGKYGMQ